MEIVKSACDEIVREGFNQPTTFEVETALAFWYFEKKQCDIVVLETGLGGAGDATNIILNTLVAVITSIGMDHMKFLGDTLEEIAGQKAGIIKKGCTVAVMGQENKVLDVVRDAAASKECKIVVSDTADKSSASCGKRQLSNIRYGLEEQVFDYGEMKNLKIMLCGKFQIDNAVLALNVIDELKEYGFEVSEKSIREGLCSTEWQGRFQILRHAPYFIVDGAHNEDAAKKLVKSLDLYFTNRRFIYIMGMLRDKECEDVVSITVSRADMIITVTPPCNPRALEAEELAVLAADAVERQRKGKEAACADEGASDICVKAADSIESAVELALKAANKDDVIIVFGSLSFLGDIIDKIKT